LDKHALVSFSKTSNSIRPNSDSCYFEIFEKVTLAYPNCTRNHAITYIEIINNTRGGIVILIQLKKGNAAIGGQI
jgi:hypothetical protein